jgi:uncharacterized protein
MTDTQKKELLRLARDSIANRLNGGAISAPNDPEYQARRGVFVSLHLDGELRGCIGYIMAYKNIADSIREMAQAAAFKDPRFSRLTQGELDNVHIEISILSEMTPVSSADEIVIGRDGLYLDHPCGSGLLLPQVPVEWKWDLPTYLKHICRKAGLGDSDWTDKDAKLFRFSAEVFSEDQFLA